MGVEENALFLFSVLLCLGDLCMVHVLVAVMGMPWQRYVEGLRGLTLDDNVLGRYFYWLNVCYVVDGYSQKALSTVPVLYNYLASRGEAPLKTVVVVQETAFARASVADYRSMLLAVEDMYREFLEWQGIGKDLEIVVAPGTGRFKNVAAHGDRDVSVFVDVCGAVSDFQHFVVMRLAKILLDVVRGLDVDEDLVVHLDISHGVNYVPTLTRSSLLELLTIVASYAKLRNVTLRVYNSEPVARGALKDVYNIHLVEEVRIRSGNRFSMVPIIECVEGRPRVLSLNKLCVKQDVEKISRMISEAGLEVIKSLGLDNTDRINAFVGALINGLPLLALEAMPRASLESFVEAVIDAYTKFVTANVRSSGYEVGVNVVKQASLHPHVRVLTKMLLAKELIAMRIKQGYDYENGVELSTLAKLAEEVLYNWSERLKITTSFDYRSILVALEKKKPIDQWEPLANFMKTDSKCDEELKEVDRFRRNFIQHSGLHSCVVEVKAEPGKETVIYRVRYSKNVIENPDLRKKIYEAASEGVIKV
jgi:CRISPR-associated protein Csx1